MALTGVFAGLKSNAAAAIGLAGSYSSFLLSLFDKSGSNLLFSNGAWHVDIVTLVTGIVSASLTAAIAYAKYIDAKDKKENTRRTKIENDNAEFDLDVRKLTLKKERLEIAQKELLVKEKELIVKKKKLEVEILKAQIDE